MPRAARKQSKRTKEPKKRNPPKPSRIYKYKAFEPTRNLELVFDQMKKARLYKNELIELELDRRERVDAAVRKYDPALADVEKRIATLTTEIDQLETEVKYANKLTRSRAATKDQKGRLKELKAEKKALNKERGVRRKDAFGAKGGQLQRDLKKISVDHTEAIRIKRTEWRTQHGLYWGNYSLAEEELKTIGKKAPPHTRPFVGEGAVGVQVQALMPWDTALRGNGYIKITVLSPEDRPYRVKKHGLVGTEHAEYRKLKRIVGYRERFRDNGQPNELLEQVRAQNDARLAELEAKLQVERWVDLPLPDPDSARSRKKCRAIVSFRIDSESDGKPIWVDVPVHLHREIPPGTEINYVRLRRRRVGVDWSWSLQFIVGTLEGAPWPRRADLATEGMCGLDINWRILPDGLRIATAIGDDGLEHTLWIPRDRMLRWMEVRQIQGQRDLLFNDARKRLVAWLKEHEAPEAFRERLETLPHWRSAVKLTKVVWDWRLARFDGDEEIYEDLEAWRMEERKLHEEHDRLEIKLVRWREDLYRNFVLGLAQRYKTIVLEDVNWRKLKELPDPEDKDENAPARVYGHASAPGRLMLLATEVAASYVKVSAVNTTLKCHNCDNVDQFDAAAELFHVCSQCKELWDQDVNAAHNLLAAGLNHVQQMVLQ